MHIGRLKMLISRDLHIVFLQTLIDNLKGFLINLDTIDFVKQIQLYPGCHRVQDISDSNFDLREKILPMAGACQEQSIILFLYFSVT